MINLIVYNIHLQQIVNCIIYFIEKLSSTRAHQDKEIIFSIQPVMKGAIVVLQSSFCVPVCVARIMI